MLHPKPVLNERGRQIRAILSIAVIGGIAGFGLITYFVGLPHGYVGIPAGAVIAVLGTSL